MTRARDIANVTVTPTFPDGSINIADLNIDGGTDIGAALVDADLMVVDDGAGGTNRKATMSRLAAYMGTKIGGGGGGTEFIVSSGDISNSATVAFTQFDASKYDSYKFILNYVKPVTDGAELRYRTSSDGGSSYDSGAATYKEGASSYNYGHIGATVGNDTNENGFSGLVDVFLRTKLFTRA